MLLAGATGGEAPSHAVCIQGGWLFLPAAGQQHMPVAVIVAGRRCRRRGTSFDACRLHPLVLRCMPLARTAAGRGGRRRGTSACGLHPLFLAGAAGGSSPLHAVCIQWCWKLPPLARRKHMPLACSVAGRRCRRRSTSFDACRFPPLLLPGAAGCETPACCLHPLLRRRIPLACSVAGWRCRRRGASACGLHPLFLAGAAGGRAPSHAGCIQFC